MVSKMGVGRGNNKGQSKGGRVAKCLEKGYRMIAQIRANISRTEIPTHNGTHKGGAAEGRPTFVGGGRRPPPIMGGLGMYFIAFP